MGLRAIIGIFGLVVLTVLFSRIGFAILAGEWPVVELSFILALFVYAIYGNSKRKQLAEAVVEAMKARK